MNRTLFLIPLLLVAGCRRSKTAIVEEPVQRLEDIKLSQSNHGTPVWDLLARFAQLRESDKLATLEEPRVSFYEKKKIISTVESRTGYVRTDSYDVTLSSSVVVKSLRDATTLTTEELVYSSQKKKFLTDKDVRVKRPGGEMRGRGLEATPDLSDIRIFNQRTVLDKAPE